MTEQAFWRKMASAPQHLMTRLHQHPKGEGMDGVPVQLAPRHMDGGGGEQQVPAAAAGSENVIVEYVALDELLMEGTESGAAGTATVITDHEGNTMNLYRTGK